jgi:type 1 glutamine amidotransferase
MKKLTQLLVLAVIVMGSVSLIGQAGVPAQGPGPAAGAAAAPAAGRGGGQGGGGPLKVLFISKFHQFDREGLMAFFDSSMFSREITWTHIEQPAAQVFYDQKNAAMFDVLTFYDAPGRTATTGPDGKVTFDDAAPEAKQAFAQMLMAGKPLVFFHHSLAAWVHTWPEYSEVIGGACDWGKPIQFRGVQYPSSGAFGGTKQHITVVDKTSPIVAGLGDGFDITDEAYACPYADDKGIHPLLRTDFVPTDPARNLGPKGKYSNLAGWYKSAENSPVVYIQHGHDVRAWTNPAFQTVMLNAWKWAASPEAMAWARKNPTRIFKNVKPVKTTTN